MGIPSVAAAQIAVEALDAYINAYYRSTKNHRSGLSVEAHLDAAESISPFLSALFAIHERVRPFNKFLGWELEKFPLGDDVWSAAKLLPRLQAITATGTWLRSKASSGTRNGSRAVMSRGTSSTAGSRTSGSYAVPRPERGAARARGPQPLAG